MGKRIPLADRILRRIERQPSGCWYWTGYKDKQSGYGRIAVDGQSGYVHRAAYEVFVGPIADGLHIDHLCRNRACCNPDHLEPVDPWENLHRSPLTQPARTECPQGHPYEGDNLYVHRDKNGYVRRMCRTCNIQRSAAYYAAHKSLSVGLVGAGRE